MMVEWWLHRYLNVPGAANVLAFEPEVSSGTLAGAPATFSNVMLWVTFVSFVQVTCPPAAMSTIGGENLRLLVAITAAEEPNWSLPVDERIWISATRSSVIVAV